MALFFLSLYVTLSQLKIKADKGDSKTYSLLQDLPCTFASFFVVLPVKANFKKYQILTSDKN